MAAVPEDLRVYAIGDIHGRLDLLDVLLAKIAEDIEASPQSRAELVFLGDYVDRGQDSKGVIERLLSKTLPAPATCLRGNHEELMLDFLRAPQYGQPWPEPAGGLATLNSYGVAGDAISHNPEAVRDEFLRKIPSSHLQFFETLQLTAEIGDYFFVHAGVEPGVPLDRQDVRDLLWIREPFLNHEGGFGKVVVHGHTPRDRVVMRANRIGVDTGAFMSGRLSAVVLAGNERHVIDTA
ncbi:metallophosphoesterase family protein [Methyloligella sp. 2.7D]|uniref:metallophosphoesterase family protein n=1 Tax=unclassified Methyloligella TaxID=2625955 RepID=UPI001FEF2547|nr:metallophosphoesterase family protein [Methyloligella sp. GL2]